MGEYADSLKKKAGKATDAHDRAKSKNQSESVVAARKVASGAKQSQAKNETAYKNSMQDLLDSGFKGAGSNFYKAPDPIVVKKNDKPKNDGVRDEQQVTVISAPVQTGLVDNINIREEYRAEARRIILSLVKSAKDLLIKYNFSSIDRVAEYALDSDREAKTEYVVSQPARPEPPFTLSEAAMQDRFSQDIIKITNSISDNIEDSVKLQWFGTIQGNTLLQGKPRISNGVSSYDMRLRVDAISDKVFVVKCYEIS